MSNQRLLASDSAERTEQHEKQEARDGSVVSYINGVANHEAKLLTLAILARQPDVAMTAHGLRTELVSLQGESPAWVPDGKLAFKYCKHSFEGIGAVASLQAPGRRGPQGAYQATDEALGIGLAMSGAMLDWSLRYPDLSVQEVFGPTTSATGNRSPELRLSIYRELLRGGEQVPSWKELHHLVGTAVSEPSFNDQIRRMTQLGLLASSSRRKSYNPTFVIEHTDYDDSRAANITHETDVVREATVRLERSGADVYVLDELLRTCQEVDPEVDLIEARRIFTAAVSGNRVKGYFHNLRIVHEPGYTADKLTSVAISPAYRQALTDLVMRIMDLEDEEAAEKYRLRALDILEDSDAVHALMAKAKRFSRGHFAQTEGGGELDRKMIDIIRSMGSVTLESLTESLSEQRISASTVGERLRALAVSDVVRVETVQVSRDRKRQKLVYSLPE